MKTRRFPGPAQVARSLVVLLVLVLGLVAPATVPVSAQEVLRVMPLGDSNTDGVPRGEGAYRTELGRLLDARGANVNFVGSQSNGPAGLADKQHEGHSGFTIAQLNGQVTGWLNANPADVVLLMAGTNDIKGAGAVDADTALDRLRALIGTIQSHPSAPVIIVSSIPPQGTANPEVAAFNAGLPSLAASAGPRVTYVNAGGRVTVGQLLPDGIHPTSAGYAVIGAAFHDALAPHLPAGPGSGGSGYWMIGAQGAVYPFGAAGNFGSAPGVGGAATVDIEATPSGNGFWALDEGGNVAARGDAPTLAAPNRLARGERAVSLSATPTGRGYWIFTNRGRAFAVGDAPDLQDIPELLGGVPLNGPVLDSVATPTGRGYYMVASDGGIFAFGDARFSGSMGGRHLNAPVESLVPDHDGAGYWLVATDGGVFAFDAPFRGSMGGTRLNKPVVGMVRFGDGYLMVASDGGIFNFSGRAFHGSLGNTPPAVPIVSVAVR